MSDNSYRCGNCGSYLETRFDVFCSRQCELEAQYDQQCLCKACKGTGRAKDENLKGEWVDCRKCQGTRYCEP